MAHAPTPYSSLPLCSLVLLSQSMPASRSSNLPWTTTTTCVLSFHPVKYCGSMSTGFGQCSGGRLFSSKAYCCGHDESLLDINFYISEVPEHSASVAIASLRTRYRAVYQTKLGKIHPRS
ncbi:hypothetical protein BDY19DRAFT_976155 [Irpex rosettiformis]|uniref:Uncharacterized protein n=1 Tax=Irpex rosettiformis TaxID=378272 RepID=A0ACB8TNU9_9APHY|nr:hypothetical protein BDY19DRAFT_976155 [Irpex rosettiformis]